MDGVTHASDRRAGIGKPTISASGGIHLGSRIVLDDEFLSCRSSVRRFRRGEVIAGAGVLIDMFARVHSGVVSASTMLPDGREFIVEIIPKSGLIGELEVLRRQTLSLEYRAGSNCELHFFEGRLLRDMISWNTVSQVLSSINWQLDRLLLPRFTGLSTFGAFSVADNIAGIPYQTFVGPLLRPLMAAFSTVEDRRNLIAAYLKATNAITFVAAPILIALALLAEPTVRILVGEKWASAAPILQWLCLVSLLGLPTNMMPPLAMVMNNTRYVALRMFVEFAVRVPVTILGIAYFQVSGALGARIVAVLVAYGASLVITRRLIGASFAAQLKSFFRPLAASLPIIAFLLWVGPMLVAMPVGVTLVVCVALCGGVAAGIFWAVALLLWQMVGKPDGIETIVVQRLMPRRNEVLTS